MSQKSWLEKNLELLEDDVEFLLEEKMLEFTERLVLEMESRNVTKSQLASDLGKTRPFVTKLLKGNVNMTAKTMVTVAHVLGCNLHIGLYPKGFKTKTFSVSEKFVPVDIDYRELETPDACVA